MRIGRLSFCCWILFSYCVANPDVTFGQDSPASEGLPSAAQQKAADQAITEASLRGDIRFLADDLLEGRGPGTRGDLLAQRYIVSQFEQLGLEPAAPGGDWIQEVPLVGVTTRPPKLITLKTRQNR